MGRWSSVRRIGAEGVITRCEPRAASESVRSERATIRPECCSIRDGRSPGCCSKHEWHEHFGPAHIRRILPGKLLHHQLLLAPGAVDEIDGGENQRYRPERALPDRRAEHAKQHAGIDRMADMRVGAGRDEIRILLA